MKRRGRGGLAVAEGDRKKHYEQLRGTCCSNLRCQAAGVEVERCQDEAPGSFTTTTRDN